MLQDKRSNCKVMAVQVELGDKDGKVELAISSIDWYAPLTRNLYTMRSNQKLCDTEIIAKEGDVIYAHSVVLAAACDLLGKTFDVPATTPQGMFKIRTTEIASSTWNCLLEYMYLGKTTLDVVELEGLKEAADTLEMENLKNYCREATEVQKNMGVYKQKIKAENQVDQGTDIEVEIMKFAAGINETLELVMDGASNVPDNEELSTQAASHIDNAEEGDEDTESSNAMYLLLNDDAEAGTSSMTNYSPSDSVELYASPVPLPEETDVETSFLQTSTTEESQQLDGDGSNPAQDRPVEDRRPAGSYSLHGRGRRKLGSSNSSVFKCGICDKLYSSKQSLERHAVLHSGVKPFTCELCGKSFQTDRYLTAHLERHQDERNFQCPICGKSFKTQRDANWHKNSVHSILRRFQCRYCPYTTKTRALLNQHSFSHTNPKEWVCKTCGKAFLRKQHLEQHASRHEGKRQYMCSTCGAEFYTIYACKEHHMRVHQGIKRYECSVCHQQYNEKKSFMKHLQKHSVDLVLKLDGGDIIIEQTVEDAVFNASTSDS